MTIRYSLVTLIVFAHDTLSAFYFAGLKKAKKILTIHSKGSKVLEMIRGPLLSKYINKIFYEFSEREKISLNNFNIVTFPVMLQKIFFLVIFSQHKTINSISK